MSVGFRLTVDHAVVPSANTTSTATPFSVVNSSTADVVVTAIDLPRWRSASRCAYNELNLHHQAT